MTKRANVLSLSETRFCQVLEAVHVISNTWRAHGVCMCLCVGVGLYVL